MSESIWHRFWYGTRRVTARSDWSDWAGEDWPETIMSVDATDDFHAKQGRATCRWELQRNDEILSVYLKRHYRLALWRRIAALIFPRGNFTPGWSEMVNLKRATSEGLAVPEVMAAAEYIGPGLRLQSCLVIKDLVGMLPLHLAVPEAQRKLSPKAFAKWKQLVCLEMARLARQLHQHCNFHKDLYLCHYYIPKDTINESRIRSSKEMDLRGTMHLIDLHRLGKHRFTWSWWLVKDLAQLLYSSECEGVTVRDRVRFWRAYRGNRTRKDVWYQILALAVRVKWWRYRDHNLKRKRKIDSRMAQEQRKAAA